MEAMTRFAVDHGGSCGAVALNSTVLLTVRFRMGVATALVLASAVEIEDSCRHLSAQPWP